MTQSLHQYGGHRLTWDDVRILDESGSYELARIAEHYVRKDERRRNRWHRRFGRWLRGVASNTRRADG